jgi:hypothetical protein
MTDLTRSDIPKPSYDEVFRTIDALKFISKELISPKVKLAFVKESHQHLVLFHRH